MNIRPEIRLARLTGGDHGNMMALSADIDGVVWDLVTVVADDKDESLWVQVYVGETLVQMPIKIVQAMLNRARKEVHSETWFERNIFSKTDPA